MKYPYDAKEETYGLLTLLGKQVLFSDARIDRKSVPEGLYHYEIRHCDEGGEPCQIGKWIMVNFYGTILSKEKFDLVPSTSIDNAYLDFDYEKDWDYGSWGHSLDSYLHSNFEKLCNSQVLIGGKYNENKYFYAAALSLL